jgi:hypothetical protein
MCHWTGFHRLRDVCSFANRIGLLVCGIVSAAADHGIHHTPVKSARRVKAGRAVGRPALSATCCWTASYVDSTARRTTPTFTT